MVEKAVRFGPKIVPNGPDEANGPNEPDGVDGPKKMKFFEKNTDGG